MTEAELTKVVRDYLNLSLPKNSMWCHTPNELGHGKKPTGFVAGWPDITIVYKGKAFFIELKRPDWRDSSGRKQYANLKPKQREVREKLLTAGCPYAVVKDIDMLIDTLKGWGLDKKR